MLSKMICTNTDEKIKCPVCNSVVWELDTVNLDGTIINYNNGVRNDLKENLVVLECAVCSYLMLFKNLLNITPEPIEKK